MRRTAARRQSLSGGNLQKFIVGREILQQPNVLVVARRRGAWTRRRRGVHPAQKIIPIYATTA